MSAARLLLIMPLGAAFAYVSIVSLVFLSQRTLLYPGTSAIHAPERATWGKNAYINTPDGETLHGLYSQGEADRPCVLLFFGNGDRVDS